MDIPKQRIYKESRIGLAAFLGGPLAIGCLMAEKVGSNFELYLSVVNGMEKNDEALPPFIELLGDVRAQWPNNQIYFNLVVERLDNVVKRLD